jgi:precorrin-3B synthase
MESGDGLIVRVRPRWGRLTAASLRHIARLAAQTGNGTIELTRRANVQIRGVSRQTWPRLRDELIELGLAPAVQDGERRPALLVCPLSGLDERCPALEPVAAELEALLGSAAAVRALSHKFSIVLSGGSQLSGDVAADVHLRLRPLLDGRADIVVAGTAHGGVELGSCRVCDVARVLLRSIEALARMGEGRRMRDVAFGPERRELIAAAGELLAPPSGLAPGWSRPLAGLQVGAQSWVGFAVPFGSASSEAWSVVADVAAEHAPGELRLTPARQVLLPGVVASRVGCALECLQRAGFETEERPGGLELVACSGAPACGSAHGETRRVAREIGALLPLWSGLSVHVSGCEKSCARDGAADVTIVYGKRGAHLGFGTDVAGASAAVALPVSALRANVVSHFADHTAPREQPYGAGPSA